MRPHRRHDDQHDALNDYLDALARGDSGHDERHNLEPDLRQTVDRFLSRADEAGMVTHRPAQARRSSMNTLTAPIGATTPAHPGNTPRITPRSWARMMPALSTGALILAVVVLTFSVFGPNGLGRGDDGEPTHFAMAPVATAAPDELSSTRPYPSPNECTVDPMTREEVIDHLERANVATYQQRPQFEQPIAPTTDQRDAILQTFNSWLACRLNNSGVGPAYQMRLETPWMTANTLPVFHGFSEGSDQRPISDDELAAYADILLGDNTLAIVNPDATPMYGTPAPSPYGTPVWAPMPADATPVARNSGGAGPVLFADDIMITGPETAQAQVVFVNEKTNAVEPGLAYTARFVLVDGQWLLDSYTEVGAG